MSDRDKGKKQRDESFGYPTFGYTQGTIPYGFRKGERIKQEDNDDNKRTSWKGCFILLIAGLIEIGIIILLIR